MGYKATLFSLLAVLIISANTDLTRGQGNTYITNVRTSEPRENENMTFEVTLLNSLPISRVLLFYKNTNNTDYVQQEMELRGNMVYYTLKASEVTLPYIDYYIVAEMTNGGKESYPFGAPEISSPIQVKVGAVSPKDKEVIIMSPERGALISPDEFFVSISLLRATPAIKKSATRVFIDNAEVTEYALFADDIILLYGDNLPTKLSIGLHVLRVDVYDESGAQYHTVQASFDMQSSDYVTAAQSAFVYRVNANMENRIENVKDKKTWYNNLGINLESSYRGWDFNSNIYVTSEEKSNLQPNNRYNLQVRSDWLELGFGDNSPSFPSLIMSGRRVRGFTGNLKLGAFNLAATLGEVTRKVEGNFIKGYYDTSANVPLSGNIISVNPSKFNGYTKAEADLGTFSRKLLAVRPYFGRGENFQFGLSYLHSKDDISSIDLGARPQENLVLGSDMMVAFDDQKFMITAQAAFALINKDISQGTFSDSSLKAFIKQVDSTMEFDDVKKWIDLGNKFITMNQFINPINPDKLPTFAAEGAMQLNYFNNFLKTTYIYRGNEYQSFGNSYVRTDVAGLNVLDRVRLFDNKLFLAAGFESLKDNLQKTKFATTTYQTLDGSVSFFPRSDMPSILFGFRQYKNSNDISKTSKDSALIKSIVDDVTNRIFGQVSYDFDWFCKHSTTVQYSTSNRTDNSVYKSDGKINSFSFSSSSYWSWWMTTNFNISVNQSRIRTTDLNYITVTLGGKTQFLRDKLFIFGSMSPSFGDLKRFSFDGNLQYNVVQNLSLIGTLRFILNHGEVAGIDQPNDYILGLQTRFSWQ